MYKVSGKNINGKDVINFASDKKEAEAMRRAMAKVGIKASAKAISK